MKKEILAKPNLRYLRPREISDSNSTEKTTTNTTRNYNSTFAKRYQLSKTKTSAKTEPKKTNSRYRQRNYSGISASSAIKENSTGILSANTWSRNRANRVKNLDKSTASQFWQSRNSLTAQKRAEQKNPDKEVRAKLKKRYVGKRRIGSLESISADDK